MNIGQYSEAATPNSENKTKRNMRLMYLQSSYTYARLSFTSSSSFNFNSYVTDDNKYRRVDTSKDHVSVVTTFPKGPPHFCSSSSYIRNFPFVSLFFFFLSCQVEQQLRYLDDRRGLLHCLPYHYGISTSCLPKQTKIKRSKKCRPQMYLLLLLLLFLGHSSPSDNTIHNIPG